MVKTEDYVTCIIKNVIYELGGYQQLKLFKTIKLVESG